MDPDANRGSAGCEGSALQKTKIGDKMIPGNGKTLGLGSCGGFGQKKCNSSKLDKTDLLFDPKYGIYIDDIEDSTITMEQLENIDHAWMVTEATYRLNGIDIEAWADKGQSNPLSTKDFLVYMDIPVPLDTLLMSRTTHVPYSMFLELLGEKTGNEDLRTNYMNYEPSYLGALMNAHKDVLDLAKVNYVEDYG